MADGSVRITGAASTAYAPSLNAQALATLTALHRAGHRRLSVLCGNGSSEEWDQSPFERCGRQLMARRKLLARSYSSLVRGTTSGHLRVSIRASRRHVHRKQSALANVITTIAHARSGPATRAIGTVGGHPRNRLTVAGAQGGERCVRRSERSSQPGAG